MANRIVQQWCRTYQGVNALDIGTISSNDRASDPEYWISSSKILTLSLGTGHSIYTNTIIPAIETATTEVIFVTCFWAQSRTLDALNDALIKLAQRHCESRLREDEKIRVRIYFSSSSLWQKLFHPSSLAGRTYSPDEWTRKLRLPRPEQLAGLDLQVKSIFILPFSVMHPKFVIVDRSRVFLPSCNVSWEDWFEGCVELNGPIVNHFTGLWRNLWADGHDREATVQVMPSRSSMNDTNPLAEGPKLLSSITRSSGDEIPSIFLPSPHHQNPQFAILPWKSCPPPPPTPLSSFLLTAFSNATKDIYLQTPNLTAPPVLSALLGALKRGINITIVTSERLMILEQLVTAGTTTKRCIAKLMKRHRKLLRDFSKEDTESGMGKSPGSLNIKFFTPVQQKDSRSHNEPIQSHVKITIIDSEIAILGSGNMDRASWYTSQELGVAFVSSEFATQIRARLDDLMRDRTRLASRI